MPKYQQGDILLLPYPYSDFSAVKKRPVIVVGSHPSIFGDYLVAKITTNIRADVFSFYLDNTLVSNAYPYQVKSVAMRFSLPTNLLY